MLSCFIAYVLPKHPQVSCLLCVFCSVLLWGGAQGGGMWDWPGQTWWIWIFLLQQAMWKVSFHFCSRFPLCFWFIIYKSFIPWRETVIEFWKKLIYMNKLRMLPLSRMLECQAHHCQQVCHPGQCQPCPLLPILVSSCPCGQTALAKLLELGYPERRSCTDPIPSCGKICNKPLPCGDLGKCVSVYRDLRVTLASASFFSVDSDKGFESPNLVSATVWEIL